MSDDRDTGRTIGLIAGGALVVFGVWFLLRSLGVVPQWFVDMWSRASWPVAIIALGVLVVALSVRSGLKIRGPLPGARLYRSRGDKWVAGVLGGLGEYLGIDPLVLRLAFIILLLANAWGLVPAYIIMAFIVPIQPLSAGQPAPPQA